MHAGGGHVYVFLVMTLAAAEAAVGLAVVLALWRLRETTDVDDIKPHEVVAGTRC